MFVYYYIQKLLAQLYTSIIFKSYNIKTQYSILKAYIHHSGV